MAYDTKADFDNAYQFRVDRYFNRDNPGVAQDPAQTGEVILHYHRFFMSPILADMARASGGVLKHSSRKPDARQSALM
jgi:hypothetical protein